MPEEHLETSELEEQIDQRLEEHEQARARPRPRPWQAAGAALAALPAAVDGDDRGVRRRGVAAVGIELEIAVSVAGVAMFVLGALTAA